MVIRDLKNKDIRKAMDFACTGMHFDWYVHSRLALDLYTRYFVYMELNRATQIIAAYEGDQLMGLLLAAFRDEKPADYSYGRGLYVKFFKGLQKLVAEDALGEYDHLNLDMLSDYRKHNSPDGEIGYLAVDPDSQGRGVATFMLNELAKRRPGSQIYLYTDEACSYKFYDYSGFERVGRRVQKLDFGREPFFMNLYMYSKTLETI